MDWTLWLVTLVVARTAPVVAVRGWDRVDEWLGYATLMLSFVGWWRLSRLPRETGVRGPALAVIAIEPVSFLVTIAPYLLTNLLRDRGFVWGPWVTGVASWAMWFQGALVAIAGTALIAWTLIRTSRALGEPKHRLRLFAYATVAMAALKSVMRFVAFAHRDEHPSWAFLSVSAVFNTVAVWWTFVVLRRLAASLAQRSDEPATPSPQASSS